MGLSNGKPNNLARVYDEDERFESNQRQSGIKNIGNSNSNSSSMKSMLFQYFATDLYSY